MMKFLRSKTDPGVTFEAIQFSSESSVEIMEKVWGIEFVDDSEYPASKDGEELLISTPAGRHTVYKNQWVLRTDMGELAKASTKEISLLFEEDSLTSTLPEKEIA